MRPLEVTPRSPSGNGLTAKAANLSVCWSADALCSSLAHLFGPTSCNRGPRLLELVLAGGELLTDLVAVAPPVGDDVGVGARPDLDVLSGHLRVKLHGPRARAHPENLILIPGVAGQAYGTFRKAGYRILVELQRICPGREPPEDGIIPSVNI